MVCSWRCFMAWYILTKSCHKNVIILRQYSFLGKSFQWRGTDGLSVTAVFVNGTFSYLHLCCNNTMCKKHESHLLFLLLLFLVKLWLSQAFTINFSKIMNFCPGVLLFSWLLGSAVLFQYYKKKAKWRQKIEAEQTVCLWSCSSIQFCP